MSKEIEERLRKKEEMFKETSIYKTYLEQLEIIGLEEMERDLAMELITSAYIYGRNDELIEANKRRIRENEEKMKRK